MNCPYCGNSNLRVIDKRASSTTSIRRRRQCESCSKRFTTYERVEKVIINVLKRDGRVEEFDREKLKRGILKAVRKRNITEDTLEDMVSDIEHCMLTKDTQMIRTAEIGEMVLKKLTEIDKLGALLFASVYKEFQSLEDIQKELERLSKKQKEK